MRVCVLIHCVVVCSQVCQCTVNSSTRRAPGTDEWGQRSAALWDHYILRSRDPRPPQNTDIKGSPLHSQKSLFPSHPALCVFLECVWLYVKSFALIGSRCLICAVVQASFSPHIWCHVKSVDWRLATAAKHAASAEHESTRAPMFTCTDRRVRLLGKELSAPLANDLEQLLFKCLGSGGAALICNPETSASR